MKVPLHHPSTTIDGGDFHEKVEPGRKEEKESNINRGEVNKEPQKFRVASHLLLSVSPLTPLHTRTIRKSSLVPLQSVLKRWKILPLTYAFVHGQIISHLKGSLSC